MKAEIEYSDVCIEQGNFDEVVEIVEARIRSLKSRGFDQADVDIRAAMEVPEGCETRFWRVQLIARKVIRG